MFVKYGLIALLILVIVFGKFQSTEVIGILVGCGFVYLVYRLAKSRAEKQDNRLRASFQKRREKQEENAKNMEGDYGRSDWTPEDEFVRHNQPNLDIPGLWIGAGFERTPHAHLITIAPPGAGKGTTMIIPNLLIPPIGSYIVTDPKGENACITARAQKEHSQKVYILDPWGEQERMGAKHGIPACGFNPFDMLRSNPDELPDNCQMIAHYLVPENPQAKDRFWDEKARSLIKVMLLHIVSALPIEEQNFWTLYKMLRQRLSDLTKTLNEMGKNNAYDGLVAAASTELFLLAESPETFGSVLSNAHNATAIFESPQLRRSLEKSEFNPYDLANGNITLYIDIPERYLQSHAAYIKIVLGLCSKAVNARPGKKVIFMVDEAGMYGKMDTINRDLTFGRGQGITIWSFFQSLSMVKDIYGDAGMNDYLAKCAVKQFFGINDFFTAQKISEMLGNKTRVKFREPTKPGEQGTYESFDYPLMRPEEIMSEPDMICFTEGLKIKIGRLPYYKVDWINEKADPRPRSF